LRRSFNLPEYALSAAQLLRYLAAPVGAVFYRGQFHVPTVPEAARVAHVRHRPPVGLTHVVRHDLAIVAHGRATTLPADHPDVVALDALYGRARV
jgi:hypothetical protein